jgi:serine/threonine-protein kinase HipA
MNGREGAVWYEDRRVGTLREDERHAWRFHYDAGWLDDGFPLSVRLPLSIGDEEVEAHAFFQGLLPEGRARQRICRQRGVAPEDDVGLLLAIGEDTAGAFSILPGGQEPRLETTPPDPLSVDELNQLIRSLGAEAPLRGEGQRFSLAGAQDKQAVIFDGESWAWPDRANPSTHILKFETVKHVCTAEFLANDTARRLGLPVVETELLHLGRGKDAVPWLRIKRYDRETNETGRMRRIHQEDLLQALGEPTVLKYQQDGGPGLERVADLLRAHVAQPARALGLLRDWQMFNYLVGNWDGHGKNLALLYLPGETVPVLAPFYDLVAIECLNLVRPGSFSRTLSFFIGEHGVPEKVTRADWELFARQLGMPPKRVLARLEEVAQDMPDAAGAARRAFAEAHGDAPLLDRFEESVRRRCKWTLGLLSGKAV